MFRFSNPEYFYLLIVIPVLALLFFLTTLLVRRRTNRFADRELFRNLVPNFSGRRPLFKFILLLLAFLLLTVMLARPQYGMITETEEKKGIEVVFALDVSNSMLAEDVQPNRLERAKLLISTLVDRMSNDKVAFNIFAGEAYPLLPITNDYLSAKQFLNTVSANMVTLQGTNLSAAIELAEQSFSDNKNVGKAIILITDGENHEEGADEAAKKVAESGKKLFILGIGTKEGKIIPTPTGPLQDSEGNVVISSLNEDMCRQLAESGKGRYIHVDNTNNAQAILTGELDKLAKTSEVTSHEAYNEQFQAFALLALLLLLLELVVMETKNPFYKRFTLFRK